MSGSSTANTYKNKQGGTQSAMCNQLTKYIWLICMEKGIHAFAALIPGKQYILADTASRKIRHASGWMLTKNIFNHLIACFGMPKIYRFVSRFNKKLHMFPGCLIFMLYMKM